MSVDLVDITAKRAALTPERIAFEDALTGRTPIQRDEDRAELGASEHDLEKLDAVTAQDRDMIAAPNAARREHGRRTRAAIF